MGPQCAPIDWTKEKENRWIGSECFIPLKGKEGIVEEGVKGNQKRIWSDDICEWDSTSCGGIYCSIWYRRMSKKEKQGNGILDGHGDVIQN